MKKKILSLTFIFFTFFTFFPDPVLATGSAKDKFNEGRDVAATGMGYDENQVSIPEVIASVIKVLLSVVGILFLALMIYGGAKWMKASGREQEVEAAKKIIQNAIIGLILVITAYAITAYVGSMFVNKIN